MSDERASGSMRGHGEGDVTSPVPTDLLSSQEIRERFEETSAALEAADLVRHMRRLALSTAGVRGLSQHELAQRTGLSQPRISQIEKASGRDGLSYAVLRKIAYACGFEWSQLLRNGITGASSPPQQQPLSGETLAAPTHSVAAAPLEAAAYKGSPVLTEEGDIILRVFGVLFDESGVPKGIQVRPEKLSGIPAQVLIIGDGVMGARWDSTKSSFILPNPQGSVMKKAFERFMNEADMETPEPVQMPMPRRQTVT